MLVPVFPSDFFKGLKNMKEKMLLAAGACAVAGFLTLSAVRKYRKAFESRRQEKNIAEDVLKLERASDECKNFRCSYWIRFQLGICFLAEAGLLAAGAVFIERSAHRHALYCVMAMIALVVWQIIWAIVDAVGNYVFLSRKNAMEIIREEKQFLQKHLKENFRKEEFEPSNKK